MSGGELVIRVFHSLRDQPRLAEQVEVLNAASRRPSPFNGTGFLETFLEHDEYGSAGQQILLLAAFDGDELTGFLPLRRVRSTALGRVEHKVEHLVTHDNDRPAMAARLTDEERCARAFYRHLLAFERGWSALELADLEPGSPLLLPCSERLRGVHARTLSGRSTALVPTGSGDLPAWFRTLDKHWRSNVARLSRRMLGAGRVEWVGSSDPRARLPLLELYLDLERRSWKRGDGLGRHPARVAQHRALCAEGQSLRLSFHFLLLDGAAVGGMILAGYPGAFYGMETGYDEAFQKLGPGHLTMLLSIREAFLRRAPALNLFGGYDYYKASWGAELAPTRTLQVFRRGSAHWLKARLGELRRRLRGSASAGRFNEARREADERRKAAPAERAETERPTRAAERALAEDVLGGLVAAGVPVERLAGDALREALPFPAAEKPTR